MQGVGRYTTVEGLVRAVLTGLAQVYITHKEQLLFISK